MRSLPNDGGDSAATIVDAAHPQFLPGANLNPRFRVVRALGKKGAVELFEVEDLLRRCRRAARVLPPELTQDASIVERLRREGQAGASVAHPGVLRVEGLERADDGSLFLVTELWEGIALSDRIAEGPLPIATAIEITQKIAAALSAIHRTQLVHRDLKPTAVMLAGSDGDLQVKLIDFGLVKVTGDWDATRLTQTVGLLGSPEYMSPEHVLSPHALDARADIYALGVVLYEMLIGVPPFSSAAFGPVLQMHLKQPPPDPRDRRPEVPAAVAQCVLRAMAKSPGDRFATARQLSVALGTPVAPRSAVPQAAPVRRSIRALWLGASAAVLLATAAFIAWRRPPPPPVAATAPAETPGPAPPSPAAAIEASPAPKGAILPATALFGGRPISWWSSELSGLRDQPTQPAQARFEWVRRQAELNELVIDMSPSAISVAPSPALAALVTRRWAGADIAAETSSAATDDARMRAALTRLSTQLADQYAGDATFRTSPRHPRVRLARRPSPTGVIRIQFEAGAYHDGDRPGLTRVSLLAMIAASTHERYPSFALDLHRAAGTLRVETGLTDSAITLEAPASELDGLAARLIRLCLAPQLAPTGLASAKARALGAVDVGDPEVLSTYLAEKAFDGPGFDNDPAGEPDAIEMLTAEDVRRHLAGPLAPANATVVLAGGFDAQRMRSILAGTAGGAQLAFERPTRDPAGTYRMDAWRNLRIVAYPVALDTPEQAAAVHLTAALIEERLFERFRASGVSYSVDVVPQHQRWLDFILITVPFAFDAPDEIGDQITTEVSALMEEGLSDQAILRNQRSVLESFAATARSPESLARALAKTADVEWTAPEVAAALIRLTPARLAAMARPWLDPSRTVQLELSPNATDRRRR